MARTGHAFTGTRDIAYTVAAAAFGVALIHLGNHLRRPRELGMARHRRRARPHHRSHR